MDITLIQYEMILIGAIFGFLYVFSKQFEKEFTNKNLVKGLFLALRATVSSIPLSFLVIHLVEVTHFLDVELTQHPSVQIGLTFIIAVKHEHLIKILFERLTKNEKK